MLGAKHRFHGRKALKGVYERGRNVRGQMISLRYAQGNPTRPYRVAVVVSRKVHKSAVARNRIRRRVYEQVRHNEDKIVPGSNLVFTVYSDQVATIDTVKLESTIKELLKKTSAEM